MSKGERISRTKITFSEYAKTWLEMQKTEIRPRTYEVYEIAIRLHLDPVIGEMKLSDIDEDDVLRVIARMKANGKKAWTIRSVLTPLGRILGHAARKGRIASNPMQRLEHGERPKVERHEMRILSREDIAKLLAGSPKRYRTILATAVLTGMRLSELLGLQWQDIDFDASVIRIRRQADRKGLMVEPKTPQAKRDIVLPPSLAKTLREHKMESRFKADGELVFPTATGRAQNGRNVSRRGLEKALANAGLAKMRFHDLRHTHCSLLISEGLNVVYVSRSMGHASPDITLKTYSHLWDAAEHAGKASAALDAVYSASS
ncbi:MAG: site-specific integrase [Actinobacteria bacterium]|nr:site-specific integrase [Actinomycetota bacterium]